MMGTHSIFLPVFCVIVLLAGINALHHSTDTANNLRGARFVAEEILNSESLLFMRPKLQLVPVRAKEQGDLHRYLQAKEAKGEITKEFTYTIVFVLIFVFSFIFCVLVLCYQPCRTCLLYCCALFVECLLLMCPRTPVNDDEQVAQPSDGADTELRGQVPLPVAIVPKQLTVAMAEAWIDIEADCDCIPSDFDDTDCASQVVVPRHYDNAI